MCVGQRNDVGEERVVLFLKLHPDAQFTSELTRHIVAGIRSELSARHVPAIILPISEIPVSYMCTMHTFFMKKQERHGEVIWEYVRLKGLSGNSATGSMVWHCYQVTWLTHTRVDKWQKYVKTIRVHSSAKPPNNLF